MMKIDRFSQFIIYGAGHNGRKICDNLFKNNHKIAGFIDNNSSIKLYKEIPIFDSEKIKNLENKNDYIIIISLLNYFDHYNIAKYLSKIGFKYIIFKNDILLHNCRTKFLEINKLLDLICDGGTLVNNTIPEISLSDFNFDIIKNNFIRENSKNVICYIPIELLFFKEYAEQNLQHILINSDRFDLFSLFNKCENKNDDNILSSYYEAAYYVGNKNDTFNKKVPKEFIERLLKSRYDVYEKMSKVYDFNPDFFNKNPVKVAYLNNSRFLVIDGTHRLSFLMLKGKKEIPCLLSIEDYRNWSNESYSKLIINSLNTEIQLFDFILNPCFYHLNFKFESICREMVISFINYIKTIPNINRLRLIELNAKSNYYATIFSIIGFNVQSVLSVEYNMEICKELQKLYGVDYKIHRNIETIDFKKIDYLFCLDQFMYTETAIKYLLLAIEKNINDCFFILYKQYIDEIKNCTLISQIDILYECLYCSTFISFVHVRLKDNRGGILNV